MVSLERAEETHVNAKEEPEGTGGKVITANEMKFPCSPRENALETGTTVKKQNLIIITSLLQVKVKFSLCLTNQAMCHENIWGSGCTNPHILEH